MLELIQTDEPTPLRRQGALTHLQTLRSDLEGQRAFRLDQLEELTTAIALGSSFSAREP
jgi:hypothetical protein